MNSSFSKVMGYALAILIVGALGYSLFGYDGNKPDVLSLSEVIQQVENGKVDKIVVTGEKLDITTNDGKQYVSRKERNVSLAESGLDINKAEIEVKDDVSGTAWLSVISQLLPIFLIVGFLWFMLRQAQGSGNQAMSFGKSRARVTLGGKNRVTFKDVAGAKEAKQELMEVVEFLKYPAKFTALGAKIPKGVLLVGPPGTGKTLLAKAVAGEAGVPFFNISGSEFVEMFVGVGASRVRDLFAQAKKNSPAIVFVDEIDAVGRQRGTGLGGGHDEREQTLNQILVEMDGFETNTNVIVIAATNRADVLDPALLRPGRFDRRVMLDRPDIKDRQDILMVHTRNKPLEGDVDLAKIAAHTPGFSGADLQNLVNEAAILAARRDRKTLGKQEFDEAIEKVLLGPERKNKILSAKEREITAYHEAGHAVVSHILPFGDPVHKISIISRGMALGFTWNLPIEDKNLYSREHFMDDIAGMLGGRVAEKLVFKQITTGASNDLQRATRMARQMVMKYGMSDKIGPVSLGGDEDMVFLGREIHENRHYSDRLAAEIDEEVSRIIDEAEKLAEKVIKEHMSQLRDISIELLKKETLSQEEFEKFFN